MFYILHGEDELGRSDLVAEFRSQVGDASMRDLNTTILDGRQVTLAEMIHASDAVPFLAEKRLVVVEGLLTRLASRRKATERDGELSGTSKELLSGLLDYLARVPDSTRLVFVEPRALPATHPVVKLAMQTDKRTVVEFPLPPKERMSQHR